MDVKTTILNGVVEEDICIDHPEGFVTFDRETHVYRLRRPLCGLKKEPCACYTSIDSYLSGISFTKSDTNANLYYIVIDANFLILVLYVDNLILIGEEKLIQSCKEDLARKFEMKDMGLMHYFPGLEVWSGDGDFFVG